MGNLLRDLQSSDASVRHRAARELGKQGRSEAVPPLIDLLQNDPERIVRRGAATALGLIGDARAVSALLAALRDHPLVAEEAEAALDSLLFTESDDPDESPANS